MQKIKSYQVQSNTETAAFSFIGKDKLAIINKDGNINIISTKDGKIIKEIKKGEEKYLSVKGELDGNYLSYITKKKVYIYNVKEDKLIGTIDNTTNDSFIEHLSFSHNAEYLLLFSTKNNFDINKEDTIIVHSINVKEAKEVNNHAFTAGYIAELETVGNKAYILLNRSKGIEQNIVVVSYDYVSGSVEWTKSFDKLWGNNLVTSAMEGVNTLAISSNSVINVLNASNGNVIESFGAKSEVIELYSFKNQDVYLAFLNDGHVNYVNMQTKSSVDIVGKYQLNLDNYKKVALAYEGFLMIPANDNRVILYQEKASKKIKEEKIEVDFVSSESISPSEVDKAKEEYKLKNKSLVDSIIYDTKKEFLFVNYTNGDIAIYNVKSKELLKTIKNVGRINHYFGKDKYGRIYLGTMSEAFILSDKYELVGHINSLCKLENDKVIVEANSKYYSINIYTLNDLLKEAKDYLSKQH